MTRQSGPRTLSVSDLDIDISKDGPRIQDVRLGERLGMSQPLNIRKTIDKNRAELEQYGSIHAAREKIETGKGARRSVNVHWLNEAQALLLCMFARTDRAAMVRKEVIEVYFAARHGQAIARKAAVFHACNGFGFPGGASARRLQWRRVMSALIHTPMLPFSQDAVTLADGEYRIHDLALAAALGFARPRDIRGLIKTHASALEKFSILVCANAPQNAETKGRGRPGTSYHLNEHQAVFLCTKSETDTATALTIGCFCARVPGASFRSGREGGEYNTLLANKPACLLSGFQPPATSVVSKSLSGGVVSNALKRALT